MSRRKKKQIRPAPSQHPNIASETTHSTNPDSRPDLSIQAEASHATVIAPAVSCTHDEYKDLSDNVRHYNTHFLGLVTIFLVISAGLVRVVFGSEATIAAMDRLVACLGGIVVTLCFWFQGETYLYRQRRFESRLHELENKMGYSQYTRLIESRNWFFRRVRLGRWFWRLFFLCGIGVWIYGIIRNYFPDVLSL